MHEIFLNFLTVYSGTHKKSKTVTWTGIKLNKFINEKWSGLIYNFNSTLFHTWLFLFCFRLLRFLWDHPMLCGKSSAIRILFWSNRETTAVSNLQRSPAISLRKIAIRYRKAYYVNYHDIYSFFGDFLISKFNIQELFIFSVFRPCKLQNCWHYWKRQSSNTVREERSRTSC